MDSMQKKIQDLSSEHQINRLSKFSLNYASSLRALSSDFVPSDYESAYLKVDLGRYGDVSEFSLLSGKGDNAKTILVYHYLMEEATGLLDQHRTALDKLIRLDNEAKEVDNAETSLEVQISSFLSNQFIFLCDTARLIGRLIECARCLVEQCIGGVCVYYPKGDSPVSLSVIVGTVSAIMRQVVTFDEVINSSNLKFLWLVYKEKVFSHFRMIEDEVAENAKGVGTFIEELDIFFTGNYFDIFLTEVNSTKSVAQKDSLALFSTAVLNDIKGRLKESQKYKTDLSEFQETHNLISITLLVVFSATVFENINGTSGVFKQLLSLHGKFACVSILPNMIWRPDLFLSRHGPELIGKQFPSYSKNLEAQRKSLLQQKLSALPATVNLLSFQVVMSIFELNNVFGSNKRLKTPEELNSAIGSIKSVRKLAGQLRWIITSLINLHVVLEQDLPRTVLASIGNLVELLVSLRISMLALEKGIQGNMTTALELYTFKLLVTVDVYAKKMTKAGKLDSNRQELMDIVEKCINGPMTRKRLSILRLIACTERVIQILSPDGDTEGFTEMMDNLRFAFGQFRERDPLFDLTFLWNRSILKVYLRNYLSQIENPQRLINFTMALVSQMDNQPEMTTFQDTLKTELVQKISQEIENRLRLDYHKKLHKRSELLNNRVMARDLRSILNLKPIRAFSHFFSVREGVETELSNSFYNLITVSPHDWRSYGEMRQMADLTYGLETVPDGLPMRSVDQACDIMEILKDLPAFVKRFCYDMNGQVFLEKASNNKHLDAIFVSHVSQSIQTHGIGVINTTVNVTYQFLKKHFHLISQALYDDHVKSRLLRDQRIVTERLGNKTTPVYPMEAGVNLMKHFRTVSMASSSSGPGYLDRLRDLLIEVGNALGFVRSMRSGRLELGANALEQFNWSTAVQEGSYHQQEYKDSSAKEAAEHLRVAVESLERNFSESADYLKMLVNAFQKHMTNDKLAHLRRFYLLVPAITMNFVEFRMNMKEFTEDGFTMGLVYVLTVLGQISAFNSLDWFTTVNKYYTDQIERLSEREKTDSGLDQEKVQQTKSLSERRFRALQQSFNNLYYNLSCSKIFFQ